MKTKGLSFILTLALTAAVMPIAPVLAEETEGGSFGEGLKWSYENKILTISGTGIIPDYLSEKDECPWSDHKKEMKGVIIEEGITSIGVNAFWGCENLERVELSNSVTTIEHFAFADCFHLDRITIPASVTSIDDDAFLMHFDDLLHYRKNMWFEGIYVEADNPNYLSVNGVLYNKDQSVIIACPAGKTGSLEIPDGVTKIAESAFYSTHLSNVVIPEGVTSIPSFSFAHCLNLNSIVIPKSVTGIGEYAFYDSINAVQDLYYAGSEEEWKSIGFTSIWPTIHYNYDAAAAEDTADPEKSESTEIAELSYQKSDKSSYKTPSFADIKTKDDYTRYILGLGYLNLLNGDEFGNVNPDKTITRAEFAAMVCRMLGYENESVNNEGKVVFDDVSGSHWASGYIYVASQLGIIDGYENGSFGPEDTVTYEQVIKMLICAIGYSNDTILSELGLPFASSDIPYPDGYITIAENYNITDADCKPGDQVLRKTVAKLMFIALNLPMPDETGKANGDPLLKSRFDIDTDGQFDSIIDEIINDVI